MKLDSPIFDRIRIKPERDPGRGPTPHRCQWPGCTRAGDHRAPMGRGREGQYFHYCTEHVRAYNRQYNYFNGMSDEDVVRFQEAALTGHRPTWQLGLGKRARSGADAGRGFGHGFDDADPFGLFGDGAHAGPADQRRQTRPLHNAQIKSLRVLGLEDDASPSEIRARFKSLVMTLHPDQNGGDRSCEDKLREVIQAYKYLKASGLCRSA